MATMDIDYEGIEDKGEVLSREDVEHEMRGAASGGSSAAAAPETKDEGDRPRFAPLSGRAARDARRVGVEKDEIRRVRVPPHRFTPLRDNWPQVRGPLVEHLQLLVRMNIKGKCVEMMASEETEDPGALQKGVDFVEAFMAGFDVDDALALLRMDDLQIESFEVTDVKPLHGEHLSRAIGRLAGSGGKTRYAIENATRTRIVIANTKIHILGAPGNIKIARDALCSLILGSPPSKVYNHMRTVASRLTSRY